MESEDRLWPRLTTSWGKGKLIFLHLCHHNVIYWFISLLIVFYATLRVFHFNIKQSAFLGRGNWTETQNNLQVAFRPSLTALNGRRGSRNDLDLNWVTTWMRGSWITGPCWHVSQHRGITFSYLQKTSCNTAWMVVQANLTLPSTNPTNKRKPTSKWLSLKYMMSSGPVYMGAGINTIWTVKNKPYSNMYITISFQVIWIIFYCNLSTWQIKNKFLILNNF